MNKETTVYFNDECMAIKYNYARMVIYQTIHKHITATPYCHTRKTYFPVPWKRDTHQCKIENCMQTEMRVSCTVGIASYIPKNP